MSRLAYTLLGWVVWQIASRVAKRKLGQNRAKVGMAAAVVLLAAGLMAARAGRSD